jgi:hypothetical protein
MRCQRFPAYLMDPWAFAPLQPRLLSNRAFGAQTERPWEEQTGTAASPDPTRKKNRVIVNDQDFHRLACVR